MKTFKVGDRVVVTGHIRQDDHSFYLKNGTVDNITDLRLYPVEVNFGNRTFIFMEHELELESIYYSPLYQALI